MDFLENQLSPILVVFSHLAATSCLVAGFLLSDSFQMSVSENEPNVPDVNTTEIMKEQY